MAEQRFTVGLLVDNHFGVLNRISGMYARRGYNIDSLSVGPTNDPRFSRMTIVSCGDDYMKEQVIRQLEKLHDVRMIKLMDEESSAFSQHMYVKIKVNGNSHKVSTIVDNFGGKIVDFGDEFLTVELTGGRDKVSGFLTAVEKYGIMELCRSGVIAIGLGKENVLSVS